MKEILKEFDSLYAPNFYIIRKDFNNWLRVWRMNFPEGYPCKGDLLHFARETKTRFTRVMKMNENEIANLGSVKTRFRIFVKFSNIRDDEQNYMERYFDEKNPAIFNRNNKETIKDEFDNFIYKVKGEIETWSQKESGWMLESILNAFVKKYVAQVEPLLRGGSYMPLPEKLQNKKAILNIQNRHNHSPREDGLNVT